MILEVEHKIGGFRWKLRKKRFLLALMPSKITCHSQYSILAILETSPEEFSLYGDEHYQWDDAHVRRYTIRRHGLGSMHADVRGGRFLRRNLRQRA